MVDVPYPNVKSNEWNTLPSGTKVLYLSKSNLSFRTMKRLLLTQEYDVIYLNSFFSYYFTILPLIITNLYKINKKIILAPRGMLSEAALSLKSFKKVFYLTIARATNIYKEVTWQASTNLEEEEIKKVLGDSVNVVKALNLSYLKKIPLNFSIKKEGILNLVY